MRDQPVRSQDYSPMLGARTLLRDAMPYQSDLLRTLDERGYIHQATDAPALDALAVQQVVPGYIGFDATAPSLHVGSLVQIMLLRRLQQTGHKPVVVMGGGTTRIGDPTGRDESRKMLSDADIDANIASIRTVFERFLTFGDGPTDAVMVNNHDWLGKLGYIELLQQVGTHFTVNRMLTFDSVKLRLEREQPMTFLEFNYMILQGYDFRHLSKDMGVRLQMGGSDQWGNIVNGVELSRRMDGTAVFGITTPLLTTADGAKMGKTAAGAVWLNEGPKEQGALPAWDFWQYWRNCDDRDVGKFLRLFTDLPLDEIARLEALGGAEINAAKITLAREVTKLCRGEQAAQDSEDTARNTFGKDVTVTLTGLPVSVALGTVIPSNLPVFAIPAEGLTIVDALVGLGFAASRGEAKRLVAGGGARVDGEAVRDEGHNIAVGSADIRISAGKKKHGILRPA